jgi:hypothetical protein
MKITLTKEQFEILMRMVYLGNWVVNGDRTEGRYEDYDKVENILFSQADKFGLADLVEYDEATSSWLSSRRFEDDAMDLLDECIEDVFWEELVRRLAWRDVLLNYGDEAVEGMTEEAKIRLESPHIEKYREEIEKNGVMNLFVNRALVGKEAIH